MYNEERKLRYIKERENTTKTSPKYTNNLFYNSEKFESMYEKDICDWNTEEILGYYKWLSRYSVDSLITLNSAYRLYTNWCMINSLVKDHQNHFDEITVETLATCINKNILMQKLVSRKDVLKEIQMLPNVSDRFCILAIFEGIKGRELLELVSLKISDIDGNIAHLCTGRDIEISDELKFLAEQSAKEYEYYGDKKSKPLIGTNDDIIKTSPNSYAPTGRNTSQSIRLRIIRCMQKIGLFDDIGIADLYESGQYHLLTQLAKEEGMDIKEYIELSNHTHLDQKIKKIYPGFSSYRFYSKYFKG